MIFESNGYTFVHAGSLDHLGLNVKHFGTMGLPISEVDWRDRLWHLFTPYLIILISMLYFNITNNDRILSC